MAATDTVSSIFDNASIAFGLETLAQIQQTISLGPKKLASHLQSLENIILDQINLRVNAEQDIQQRIETHDREVEALEASAEDPEDIPNKKAARKQRDSLSAQRTKLDDEFKQIESAQEALDKLPHKTVIAVATALLKSFQNEPASAEQILFYSMHDYLNLPDEAQAIFLILVISTAERALQNSRELSQAGEDGTFVIDNLKQNLQQSTTGLGQVLTTSPEAPEIVRCAIGQTGQVLATGALRLFNCIINAGLESPPQPTISEILNNLSPADYSRVEEPLISVIEKTCLPPSQIRAIVAATQENTPSLAYYLLALLVDRGNADVATYRLLTVLQERTEDKSCDWALSGLEKGHDLLWEDYLQKKKAEIAPLLGDSYVLVPDEDEGTSFDGNAKFSDSRLQANRPLWNLLVQISKEARHIAVTAKDQVGFSVATIYSNAAAVYDPRKPNIQQCIESMKFLWQNRRTVEPAAWLLSVLSTTYAASYFTALYPNKTMEVKEIKRLHRGLCDAAKIDGSAEIRNIMPYNRDVFDNLLSIAWDPVGILESYERTKSIYVPKFEKSRTEIALPNQANIMDIKP